MTQPKNNEGGPDAADWYEANYDALTTRRFAPRKTGPYSAEELAELRTTTEHHDPSGMTRRLLATLDAREAERDAMADAVRALLADVESPHGEKMDFCDAPRCRCLAMYNDGDMAACDEHQGILVAGDIEDMSYAPAVRTLRAMLDGKPGEPPCAVERIKAENEALRAAMASNGEAMANLCGLLGLTDAVASRGEGQHMVHAAVERLKVEGGVLREAARVLLVELDKEARQCGKCYALATVAQGLPRGGFVFHCDKHATPLSAGWQDDPREDYPTNVAAPLRALRALLTDPSLR